MEYPYSWTTAKGHDVVIFNPCEGRYEFHILTKDGKKNSMVFKDDIDGSKLSELSEAQKEIYKEWTSLQEQA